MPKQCLDCGHRGHEMTCHVVIGGSDGPTYCPCSVRIEPMELEIIRLRSAIRELGTGWPSSRSLLCATNQHSKCGGGLPGWSPEICACPCHSINRASGPADALARALADNGIVDTHPAEQYQLVEVLPILAALASRGYEVRTMLEGRLHDSQVRCGHCGDWLEIKELEGHLNAEGRSLLLPEEV